MGDDEREFEDEVRRIARQLWPEAEHDGAAMVQGRERDGIFETEDCVHCVECTVSRQKDKAKTDRNKLEQLIRQIGPGHRTKHIQGWFITRDEPTADQRTEINKSQVRIIACSFDQLRSKLVDARSYLTLRGRYPFGSVRDPATGKAIHELDYVPLDITDDENRAWTVSKIAAALLAGDHIVLTGDYGAGKSATLREIYHSLACLFDNRKTLRFPIFINLRDHHGQSDPVEMLERHARKIGFPSPHSLVRAWRAGYTTLLLDGFDEIAAAGWAGLTKSLKDLRWHSMELLRTIERDTPPGSGLLVAGRAHFFNSEREMIGALGLIARVPRLQLSEFSVEQVAVFLERQGWNSTVPEWLPTRPLLIAYLARKQLLDPATIGHDGPSPAAGWHHLLDRIAERESEIEAGIDPATVRRLVETLASIARNTLDGIGPLSPDQIQDAFKKVCGYAPDDRGAVLLQRLPGLGGTSGEDGSRVFVDRDFVDAARAGDVFRYMQAPYGDTAIDASGWEVTMRPLGVQMTAYRCSEERVEAGRMNAALRKACSDGLFALGADILATVAASGVSFEGEPVYVKEVVVEGLVLEGSADLHGVEFQDSVFGRLEISADASERSIPMFRRCHFALVAGRTSERDLPDGRFADCDYEEFELDASTTRALLSLPLPVSCRVLLTVLKKIYVQKGAGRKEGALSRGLDANARAVVAEVLALLRREGFLVRTRQGTDTVWLPSKDPEKRRRALAMLAAPLSACDGLLDQAKELT